MFEYKKMSKNELEQVIKKASLKIGVNEVILKKIIGYALFLIIFSLSVSGKRLLPLRVEQAFQNASI